MPILVYSFDPGKTTGYTHNTITDTEVVITVGQKELTHAEIWKSLIHSQVDIVVSESFEYRNRSRDNIELISKEYIGIFKLYAELTSTKLVMQTAANGKGHYTDDKLKAMNLYPRGYDHGRDAIRHFLQWFTFGGGFEFNKDQEFSLIMEAK